MATAPLRALNLLRSRASARSTLTTSRKTTQRRSFVYSASKKYGQSSLAASSSGGHGSQPFWAPLIALPLAYGAFWGSSGHENTLEKVNEDIEKLAFQLNRPDEETAKLASIVIEKVLALSAAEIRRDTMYVLAAVSTAAKVLAEVDPDSSEAQRGVVQCYALAKRIASDSKQPDELKLDALRCAHKAEYFVFVFRNDYKGMKAILEKDLKAVRDHYRVKKGLEQMSFEESSALFMLAAVLANMEDSSAQSVLEQSIDIFKGISKETITPELEKVWIERITATLTHAYTLEIASHPVPAKEFKRIALALYEQFSRVAVTNTAIPTWKRLETELKQAALANGPP